MLSAIYIYVLIMFISACLRRDYFTACLCDSIVF